MNTPAPQAPFPVVAWTAAALLIAAGPHLAAMPAWLAGLIAVLVGWRLAAAARGWKPPPGWVRIGVALLVIVAIFVAHGGLWGRRAATALLCLMLGAKMLELFRVRDLRLVASVCFFLIATQFLFSERLVYVSYLLVGSLVTIIALIFIQRLDGFELDRRHNQLPETGQAIRQGVIMLVAAVPVALTLFVLFPRLAQPLWGLPDQVMDGRTGLSDTMSPGSIANLFLDDSPAFRAEFDGDPPPPDQRYWRGPVLWHFDGDTWHPSSFITRRPARPVLQGRRSWHYRVQLEPHEQRWLFALDYPVEPPDGAHTALDFQIISRNPITTLTQYEVTSNPDFIDMPRLGRDTRRLALQLPDGRNPRTIERARQLREHHPHDRDLINAVLRWFREDAFYYSLETALTGRHGADEFLFDLRTGYCEHYASAFAILMRAAGIPTRVVTGYQGGFWQSGGQYLLVRQSDAHAWVEVWLEGNGWTRVDPTAAVSPTRINQGSRRALDRSRHWFDADWVIALRNRYDRVQHLWNSWVLGFDADRQQRLLRWMGLPSVSPTTIGVMMVIGLALVVVIIALVLLKGNGPNRTDDPVQRAWLRLVRRLGRSGLVRNPGETPLEFIERAAGELEFDRPELVRLGTLYCRAHYGPSESRAAALFIEGAAAYRPARHSEPPRPLSV